MKKQSSLKYNGGMNWIQALQSRLFGKLTTAEESILIAMFQGCSVRSHRDIEGNKQYLLHLNETDPPRPIDPKIVPHLRELRLIETNHKFPASTYLLTGKGNQLATKLADGNGSNPLTARDFIR